MAGWLVGAFVRGMAVLYVRTFAVRGEVTQNSSQ